MGLESSDVRFKICIGYLMHRSSLWLKPIYSLLLCQCIYCWNSRNPHVYTEEKAQKRAFVMTLCQVTVSPR